MNQNYGLTLVTGPTVEPITLAEAKIAARVQWDSEDDYITGLIKAARRHAEQVTKRQLIHATRRITLDYFPRPEMPTRTLRRTPAGAVYRPWWMNESLIAAWDVGRIPLPWAPLASVVSITYDDADGVAQALDSEEYRVLADRWPGEIEAADEWPETYDHSAAVRIVFVSGYGATADDVPEDIRQALLWLVAWWYEKREPEDKIPEAFERMLSPYNDFGTFAM